MQYNHVGGDADGSRHTAPLNENGESTVSTVVIKGIMDDGMTRETAARVSQMLGLQRQIRTEYSARVSAKPLQAGKDESVLIDEIERVFEDGRGYNPNSVFRDETGHMLDPRVVAGAMMPTPSDAIAAGFSTNFLETILDGKASDSVHCDHRSIGIKPERWHYRLTKPDPTKEVGPADYDFQWAMLDAFKKLGASDSSKTTRTVWTTAARVIQSACMQQRSAVFSLITATSTTLSVIRDTLFLIAQDKDENKMRLPQSDTRRRSLINKKSCMQSGCQSYSDADPQAKVHPQHMLIATRGVGNGHMRDPEFENPCGIERPEGGPDLGNSLAQKRFDHLNLHEALPGLAPPQSFKLGVPIMTFDSSEGIYCNKFAMREHAHLVVEISTHLAQVPGIAGASHDPGKVPQSFQNAQLQNRDRAAPRAGRAARGPAEVADGPQPPPHQTDGDLAIGTASFAQPGSTRTAGPGTAATASMESTQKDATVASLPYSWDMSQEFLTMKMIETLHNDCEGYIEDMRRDNADVFDDEDQETTLRDLPQFCLRFLSQKSTDVHFPLSMSAPLQPSRTFYIQNVTNQKKLEKGVVEAALSLDEGREVTENEDVAKRFKADVSGVGGMERIKGNIFARSSWEDFTFLAMEANGTLNQFEIDHIFDQGIGILPRIINADAVTNPEGVLIRKSPVQAKSCAAQERSGQTFTITEDEAVSEEAMMQQYTIQVENLRLRNARAACSKNVKRQKR